ncbi:hypothetical protein DMENIID0001_067210 [Sergentomyia squamirostris]
MKNEMMRVEETQHGKSGSIEMETGLCGLRHESRYMTSEWVTIDRVCGVVEDDKSDVSRDDWFGQLRTIFFHFSDFKTHSHKTFSTHLSSQVIDIWT